MGLPTLSLCQRDPQASLGSLCIVLLLESPFSSFSSIQVSDLEPNIFPQSEWFSDVLLISVLSLTGTYKGRAGCSCPLSSRLCAAWEQGLGLPQQSNRPVEQPGASGKAGCPGSWLP